MAKKATTKEIVDAGFRRTGGWPDKLLGLSINFNAALFKDRLTRFVNGL